MGWLFLLAVIALVVTINNRGGFRNFFATFFGYIIILFLGILFGFLLLHIAG